MRDLIERLKAADGPSRELDAEIATAIEGHVAAWPTPADDYVWFRLSGPKIGLPEFTGSVDAAMTLVPEEWTGLLPVDDEGDVWLWPKAENGFSTGVRLWTGKPPAIALTIAALKAMLTRERLWRGKAKEAKG